MQENLKHRHTMEIKKSKNVDRKQLRRMNFMGIPIAHADATKKCTQSQIQTIVTKISQTSLMKNDLSSKNRVITTKDGGVKFSPVIPAFESDDAEECKQKKAKPRFKKAQPRGNDPKMLRVDKSLPWIDAAKMEKLEMSENHEGVRKSALVDVEKLENIAHINNEAPPDENVSAIKKSFNGIIASKLQDYATIGSDLDEMENSHEVQSIESTSTLSSIGTNFSSDSGSYLMILDKKVPKTQLNIANKFQVRDKKKHFSRDGNFLLIFLKESFHPFFILIKKIQFQVLNL